MRLLKCIVLLIPILAACSQKKTVEIYKITQRDYEINFIGISNQNFTPDDFYKEIITGNYKDSIDVNYLSINDFGGKGYVWFASFHNLELLLDKEEMKDSFSVTIQRHDLAIPIPTITNVDSIPIKWFGFWGDSFSVNRLFIDSFKKSNAFGAKN